MKTFHFPLEKALQWRNTELQLEESRYKQQSAELAGLDRRRADMEATGIRAELQVREWNSVGSGDLTALGSFRLHVKSEEAGIARLRDECAGKLADRKKQMMGARRRCRLLERLKERRLAEWKSACDHELEEIAAESYLSRWHQTPARGGGADTERAAPSVPMPQTNIISS